jgi:hypothetical protein
MGVRVFVVIQGAIVVEPLSHELLIQAQKLRFYVCGYQMM